MSESKPVFGSVEERLVVGWWWHPIKPPPGHELKRMFAAAALAGFVAGLEIDYMAPVSDKDEEPSGTTSITTFYVEEGFEGDIGSMRTAFYNQWLVYSSNLEASLSIPGPNPRGVLATWIGDLFVPGINVNPGSSA